MADTPFPSAPERVVTEAERVPAPVLLNAEGAPVSTGASAAGFAADQLARIEDKTARLEEKFARQEANATRVLDRFDQASARMSEVALQSELAAVRGEVGLIARRMRGVPGHSALMATAVVTAILTAVLVILVLRYLPGFLPR